MSSYTPGPMQIAVLRTCSQGEAFMSATRAQQRSCMALHERGLLDRDLGRGMSRRFIGNEAGTKFIQEHDDALASAIEARRA
jgi:hypothetical protein